MRKMLNVQQLREEKHVKKGLSFLMALGLVMLFAGTAFAAAQDVTPYIYNLSGNELQSANEKNATSSDFAPNVPAQFEGLKNKGADFTYYEQGKSVLNPAGTASIVYGPYSSDLTSTHPQGTWNSPYTYGVDGYNYNDPQDYVAPGQMITVGDPYVQSFPVHPLFQAPVGAMMFMMYGMGDGSPVTSVTAQMNNAFTSGPHGGYLTSTHKCRECHAVHRAAGKFKLTRSNTRYEACDWCHGTGAGSGYNIQMDNNDDYTREYNTGHSMGFGIQNGKWKAPDDTYPAFTPPYWQGGFTCFDCHSPHANPQRMIGFDDNGLPIPSIVRLGTGQVFNIGNPGHDMNMGSTDPNVDHANINDWVVGLGGPIPKAKPYFQAGSWLLIEDPDKEINDTNATITAVSPIKNVNFGPGGWDSTSPIIMALMDGITPAEWMAYLAYAQSSIGLEGVTMNVAPGAEIPDKLTDAVNVFSANTKYPVNKAATDWNNPIGAASFWDYTNTFQFIPPSNDYGYTLRSPLCRAVMMSEFCTDCHDGNAGLSTIQAPMFSEDRALRSQANTSGVDGFPYIDAHTLEPTNHKYCAQHGTDLNSDNPGFNATDPVQGTTVNPMTGVSDFKGQYDIAYSHDANKNHCGRAQRFNPEDGQVGGPHCRNCHKGSSGCSSCHNGNLSPAHYEGLYTTDTAAAADNSRTAVTSFFVRAFEMVNDMGMLPPQYIAEPMSVLDPNSFDSRGLTTLRMSTTSDDQVNGVAMKITEPIEVSGQVKSSRMADWTTTNWRANDIPTEGACSDDGLSWPHRTLGWKMLKDDLFGIDVTGSTTGDSTVVAVGQTRTFLGFQNKLTSVNSNNPATTTLSALYNPAGPGQDAALRAHDLDSVCLDCHNPTIWNATKPHSTTGDASTPVGLFQNDDDMANQTDNMNDELLLRGLP